MCPASLQSLKQTWTQKTIQHLPGRSCPGLPTCLHVSPLWALRVGGRARSIPGVDASGPSGAQKVQLSVSRSHCPQQTPESGPPQSPSNSGLFELPVQGQVGASPRLFLTCWVPPDTGTDTGTYYTYYSPHTLDTLTCKHIYTSFTSAKYALTFPHAHIIDTYIQTPLHFTYTSTHNTQACQLYTDTYIHKHINTETHYTDI